MNELNYAKVYSQQLAQAFPYVLNFGALYSAENKEKFRFKGGNKIELPIIKTSGRTDNSRSNVGTLLRNFENTWEEKLLTNHRRWSTLIHPQDIDETNYAASIANITSVFNNEHKFPEMDAYTIYKIYWDWIGAGKTAIEEELTTENILSVFDDLMANMTEARVPVCGRILYVTPSVMKILKNASAIGRSFDVKNTGSEINRTVTMLDGVTVIEVPAELMKTEYDFNDGWAIEPSAAQVQMFLIHPDSVVAPVCYEFACLDKPSAATGGKYVYYEESSEDVFLLNRRADGVAFVLEPQE